MSELTINERIKFLIEKSGMSVRAFSTAMGVTDTNTRNYIDRGSKPNSEFLEKLIRRFNDTNPTWLLLGEGEPFISKTPDSGDVSATSTKNNSGNSIGINHGKATQQQGGQPGGASRLSIEASLQVELNAYKQEVEFLKAQLAMKDQVIASKQESIDLLKAAYGRPN